MSKHLEAADDRIPTYEESIATPSSASSKVQRSNHHDRRERLKQERMRRVSSILVDYIDPAIDRNLENGVDNFIFVILPAGACPGTSSVDVKSIISPHLKQHSEIVRLKGDDNQPAFIQQWVVVQDLSDILLRSMSDPSSIPELQALLPEIRSAALPDRPAKRSWLNRTFGVPPEGHDPTGSTGKWNLGWRMEENQAEQERTISSKEMIISTRLQDVSFRTESEMGLLESTNVKCIWMEIRMKT